MSGGVDGSPKPSVATPSPLLRDLLALDGLMHQHAIALEDAQMWATVIGSCISDLESAYEACDAVAPSGGTPALRTDVPIPALSDCVCASGSDPYACGDAIVYYQSLCGEPAYVDSLTMRAMLEAVGGKHSALPATFDAAVVQIDVGVLTPELRAKTVFLRSLPLHTCLYLCEVDLQRTPFQPAASSPLR